MKKIVLILTVVSLLLSSCQNTLQGANMDLSKTKLIIEVNSHRLSATLENNSSATALVNLLKERSLTISMRDYGDFEKVGSLGSSLPRNDRSITTTPGDIILYQGNQITIYYDRNSWNFTKLGHIDNISQSELMNILGDSTVSVTFSIEEEE